MRWVCAAFYFSALFSYRIPNLSPSYALTSIIPSPSSLRLALVDAAIKLKGSVDYGIEIFNLIKTIRIEIEPPDKVAVLKFFIKRLKPPKSKDSSFEESFGIREYCHFNGPIKAYFELFNHHDEIVELLKRLRRLGTSDSLLSCKVSLSELEPDSSMTCKLLSEIKPEGLNFKGRPVVILNELKEDAEFIQLNPYSSSRKGMPFISKIFILPLIEKKKGENFVLYEKSPFSL
ncbi:MAG: hypothetical protein N3B16_04825 [Candidatus Aminicenantes bacterium]|nr:hypothetical protein [Candidatus Aminicenantes bacterium]